MFNTILVASDGSSHARSAVNLASDIAEKYGARMVILHVMQKHESEAMARLAEVEYGADLAGMPGSHKREAAMHEALIDLGRRILEQAEHTAREKGVKNVQTLSDEGDPVTQVLACAKREHADLIVMGSRGLSDLKGLLLGSVSHKVSQLAECTCVTVK